MSELLKRGGHKARVEVYLNQMDDAGAEEGTNVLHIKKLMMKKES